MVNYKKWSIQVSIIFAITLLAFAGFNYGMDPFWMFGHKHKFNKIQYAYDERMMKTNEITYQPFHYDTLLLGNSRSTFIDPSAFQYHDVYNYSVASLDIIEYDDMISYAKNRRGQEFETIILGLDFLQLFNITLDNQAIKAFQNIETPFHRSKSVLSLDTFNQSLDNLKMSILGKYEGQKIYGHQNHRITSPKSEEQLTRQISKNATSIKERITSEKYKYLTNYKQLLIELKTNNPHTQFIVYTPFVYAPIFQQFADSGRFDEYQQWLTDTVDVFGEVHHFMYDHSATRDLANFDDGVHFNEYAGRWIAHRIEGGENPSIPADFGVVLTEDNLDAYFKSLESNGNL